MDNKTLKRYIQFPIFESRWILWVFYMGLVAIQAAYCVKFCQGIFDTFRHAWSGEESQWLVIVLTFLDMAMIANLIQMIISGSYQSFVDKLSTSAGERFSSGALKVKMGTSLVVVSAINILKTCIDASHTPWDVILKQCGIHVVFAASAWVVAHIEFMHDQAKGFEVAAEAKQHKLDKELEAEQHIK